MSDQIPTAEESCVQSQRDLMIEAVKSLKDGMASRMITLKEYPDETLIAEMTDKGYNIKYTAFYDTTKSDTDRYICNLTVTNPRLRTNKCDLAQMFQENMQKLGIDIEADENFKHLINFVRL